MLPGDYIAMKLSGDICTTVSGLSEGMFWDFKNNRVADFLMDYYGFDCFTYCGYQTDFCRTRACECSCCE